MEEKVENKLKEIWAKYKGKFESDEVSCLIDRGYVYATPQRDNVLVTGINPSFLQSEENKPNTYTYEEAVNPYYSRIRNVIDCCFPVYLDLFYFRNSEQSVIAKILKEKNGIEFLADQLAVTKETIEWIQPTIIIVLNKGSWTFYGKNPTSVWMGYEFQKEKDMEGGELHRIVGFRDSNEIIAPEIKETNLVGTYVYFSRSLNRMKKVDSDKVRNDIHEIVDKHFCGEKSYSDQIKTTDSSDSSDFEFHDTPLPF